MKKTDIVNATSSKLIDYYNNNIQPFLDSFSDNGLWIGPAKGQIINGKKNLVAAFSADKSKLTFALQNLEVIPLFVSDLSVNVLLLFTVFSYYPNGEVLIFNQRIDLLWMEETNSEKKKDFFIRFCHISNEYPFDSRDKIYPNHFTELDISKYYAGKKDLIKVSLKGLNNSFLYLSINTIIWIESKNNHTVIHTTNGIYESIEKLNNVLEKFKSFLIKVHISYAINPFFVSQIGRFYVEMDDKTKLSIPEKKYTKTRDEINERINLLNKKTSN